MFYILLAIAAAAGLIAAIAGFGIGSVLTPTLAIYYPAKLAVAAVSFPHFVATAYRLWLVRAHIDWGHLKGFGAMSAMGGLAGAAAGMSTSNRGLEIVLGVLLLFVGVGGLTGWAKKLRFTGSWAWLAGGVSGFLGGLVGNQGGIRAGAMLGLGVSREAFVATSTAIGLVVDMARMPVYVAASSQDLIRIWPVVVAMVAGVVVGTYAGTKFMKRIHERAFFQVVSILLLALGMWLIFKP
jgi:uncharacterized membrane protein YfcA